MKLIRRALLAIVVVLAVAGLALAAGWRMLPERVAQSETVRETLRRALEAQLGQGFAIEGLAIELDPPALTATRLAWTGGAPAERDVTASAGPGAAEAKPPVETGAVRVAFDPAALLEGRLASDDLRAEVATFWVEPDKPLVLLDVSGSLRSASARAPYDVDLTGRLAGGGRVHLKGTADPRGPIALDGRLDAAALAQLAPFFPEARQLEGAATGDVRVRGPAERPDTVALDLRVDGAHIAVKDVALRQVLRLKADLAALLQPAAGGAGGAGSPFQLDATDARLRYAKAYEKPAGVPAHLEGTLVRGANGRLEVDGLRLRIGQ